MATIAQIASGEDFSILLGTVLFIDDNLNGSDLVGALSGDTDLTVFAPTNAAFGQLAANLGYTGDVADAGAVLAFLAGNVPVATLNAVVTYHVLPGAQFAADIAAHPTLTTLQGATITADLPTLVDNEPDLLDPTLLATDIVADNGVVHVIDQVLLPIDLPGNDAPTITDIVLTSGSGFDANGQDFDLLREAVVAADLAGALADPNADLTAFAPNDAAFVSLAQTLGFAGSDEGDAFSYIVSALRLLSKGGDPIPLLEAVLLYHVAPESLQSSQVLALDAIPTLLGADIGRDGTTLLDGDPDVADPNLIALDIQAANGIVHVIDGVLLPVDLLQSDGNNDVDFIIAGDGNDRISTKRDDDFIDGGAGHDRINAGSGDDVVLGGSGNDLLLGQKGNDFMAGEAGNDHMLGHGGRDEMTGGDGHDYINGGRGKDTIDGGSGNDNLIGGRGADIINGGSGRDNISGGIGNDTIDGGSGNDVLHGGRGADTFVFDEHSGDDVIIRFSSAQHDQIDLTAFGFDNFDQVEHLIDHRYFGQQIDLGATDIFLVGTYHQLTEDDFIL